jgi:hypothetical protein
MSSDGEILYLRATGVLRRAGALGGRPRANLSPLVSALTTIAAAMRVRTDANFIMLFVSRRVREVRCSWTRRQRELKESWEKTVGVADKKVL